MLQVPAKGALREHLHLSSENLLKVMLQSDHIEQRSAWLDIDEEVDVALLMIRISGAAMMPTKHVESDRRPLIIPKSVAHAWDQITDQIPYISVRPDPIAFTGWLRYPLLLRTLSTLASAAPARCAQE